MKAIHGRKLLLVDLENKQKIDLSPLDESFRAIIFVGLTRTLPRLPRSQRPHMGSAVLVF